MTGASEPPTATRIFFQMTLAPADAKAYWRYLTMRGPRAYLVCNLLLLLTLALGAMAASDADIAAKSFLVAGLLAVVGFTVLMNRIEYRSARLNGAAQVWVDPEGFTVALNGVSVAVPWSVVTLWGLTRRHLVIVVHDEFGYAFPLDQFASVAHRHALTIGLQRHGAGRATGVRRLSNAERSVV